MTLILPLLISNGSWGSDLPECDGSPLDIVSSAEDAPLKLMMVFDWNNCQGKFTFDGERYIGEFKYGLLHGQGTYTHADGDQYDGEWKDGSEHGQGTYISRYGNKYVGEWKDGAAHGQGTYTWTSGEEYIGEWKDGTAHGQGTYTWTDGDKYVGEWKDDKRHGQGTYTHADGSKEEGIWKDDKFLYENIVVTKEDEKFCQEIGFTINTPEYDKCVQKSAERD